MNKLYAMPMLYGVGFYQNKNCALCYVDKKGKSHLKSFRNKGKIIFTNICFFRGIEYLIFGTYFFVKNLLGFPIELKKVKIIDKAKSSLNVSARQIALFGLFLLATILGIVFFGYIPIKIAIWLSGTNYNMFLKKLFVALIKIALLLIFLITLKTLSPFRQFYRFNAAANLKLNNLKNKKSIHLPTNYLNYIIFSVVINFIILSMAGLTVNTIIKPLINILITIVTFAVCYEILYFLENSKLKISKLCVITSFLITEKPTKAEDYAVMSAYNEVLLMKNLKRNEIVDTNSKTVSFSVVYATAFEKLKNAGINEPSEIEWLMCEVLGEKRSKLKLIEAITKEEEKLIYNAVERRIKGEPITKIFGRTEFYGYEFIVNRDVLSPRMETEILVESVLKNLKPKSQVLDLCTGSGIIAVCIAKNSACNVTATDISEKALVIARKNAEKNKVKVNFKNSNLFEKLKKRNKFDIIVSNPPYIKTDDLKTLDVEVLNYDPILALNAGKTGYEFYEKIINLAPLYLKKEGMIFFEIGIGQEKYVKELLKKDFTAIKSIKDYNKIERVVYARLKK